MARTTPFPVPNVDQDDPPAALLKPRRFLAVAATIVVFLLLAYAAYAIDEDYAQSRRRVLEDATEITRSIAGVTATGIGKAELVLDQATHIFPLMGAAASARQAHAALLERIAGQNKEIDWVAEFDANGKPVVQQAAEASATLVRLPDSALEHHRKNADKQVLYGASFTDPRTKRAVLPLSKRINGSDGTLLGVVVVGISLDHLQAEFAKHRRSGDSRILLVNAAGHVLVRHPASSGPVNISARNGRSPLADIIQRNAYGQIETRSPFDGVTRSYTFLHLEQAPLTVLFGETVAEQMSDWRKRTYLRVGYLLIVLSILAAAVAYIDLLIRRSQSAHAALSEALAKANSLEFALHQHAMISRTDVNDRIVGVNDKFCTTTGYGLDELVGNTHRIISSGEHPPEFFAGLHTTIRAGEVWTGDICNKTKQGDFFWSRTTIVPFRNAAGKVYEYVAVRTDISELKFMQRQIEIANESIRASFDLLYATVNSSASGIVTTNSEGMIVLMNAAAEEMLGYSQHDAEGLLSLLELHDPGQVSGAILAAEGKVPADLGEVTYEALAAAVAASPEREWTYRTKSGAELPISLNIAPLTDQRGELHGYVTSFNDLTRLKQLEVMKSDFVSMVSHELRTPLTSIKGALTLLDKMAGASLPDNQRKLLNIGVHNCEALVNLVSDILDFEKISRNAMTYDMQVHDARTLVAKAVADTQPYAAQFNVSYWVDDSEGEMPVQADPHRFEQVMRNLLSNAAKFSHAGSEVLVSVHAERGIVTISVADSGVGIPAEFQSRVFQRFSQVNHADRPTKVKGTGLGLAIAKMMIEAHGGTIGFHSTEGLGTTFFIKLPLRLDQMASLQDGSLDA